MPSATGKEFLQPSSHQEVVELLVKYGDRALVVGGGTFLHGLLARGVLHQLDVLVDLQNTGLSYVKQERDALCIGATTTFAELAVSERVQNKPELGAVLDALQYPPAQIRNMATVGGCVASATPLFDLPVAFMVLDSSVKAIGPKGAREIGLHKFYLDYFEHVLERTELLTETALPVRQRLLETGNQRQRSSSAERSSARHAGRKGNLPRCAGRGGWRNRQSAGARRVL